jgi:hypothetical protein
MRGRGSSERWGIEDVRGNEIVPFGRFDEIAMDFTSPDGNFLVMRGRTFYLINSKGNEIATFDRYDEVTYVTSNRFIVSSGSRANARAGVIDARGNEIISVGRYTNIQSYPGGNWYRVWDGNRMGLLDARGNEVISVGRYDTIEFASNDRFLVSAGSWPNTRMALLDARGTEVISLGRYDEIRVIGNNNYAIREGERWGVFDARGNEIISVRYDNISGAGNHFIVRDGDRVGVLDNRGTEVITMGRYDRISYAFNGRFTVATGDSWRDDDSRVGIVDARGNEVIAMGRYNLIQPVPGDRFIVATGEFNSWGGLIDGRWSVVDARGNEIISPGRFDSIEVINAWHVNSFDIEPDPGFVVTTGDRGGFLNLDGKEIIPMGRYDDFYGIFNGLAIVERNDRIGVINTRRSSN